MRLKTFLAVLFLSGSMALAPVLTPAGQAQTAAQSSPQTTFPQAAPPAPTPGVSLPASLSPPAALATVPAATSAAPATVPNDADTPAVTGRNSVIVQDDMIRLSDIFDGTLANPDKPILHAPSPGETLTLDRSALQRIARDNGLKWMPLTGNDKLTLTRDGNAINSQDILAAIVTALEGQGLPPSAELETGSPVPKVVVSPSAKPEIVVTEARYNARDGQFSSQVEVRSGTVVPTRLSISGRVFETVDIPVLSRALARGQEITPTDILWQKYRIASLPQGIATTFDQLSGMAPKRTMRTGEPVLLRDIERPAVVEKGKAVTMILRTPYIQLTAQGKALENGAIGELIKVQNSRSGKAVNATVIDAHTVSVDTSQSGSMR